MNGASPKRAGNKSRRGRWRAWSVHCLGDLLQHQGIPGERWNDASAVVDPDGKGPRIFFQRVPEGEIAKNRMHMDLNVSGGRSTALEARKRGVDAEVARLKTLGATDQRGGFG